MITASMSLPMPEIEVLCRQFDVRELSVFGSVLRDDFDPDRSDVDFLVVFRNDDLGPWMGKLSDLEDALGRAVGRKVDLVLKSSVAASQNHIRRDGILNSAQVIYES